MRQRTRRELDELRDPANPRQQMSPMADLELMDEQCRQGAVREKDAICGCDSQFRLMDPIGTAVGQPGPDPVEDEFDLLPEDPIF